MVSYKKRVVLSFLNFRLLTTRLLTKWFLIEKRAIPQMLICPEKVSLTRFSLGLTRYFVGPNAVFVGPKAVFVGPKAVFLVQQYSLLTKLPPLHSRIISRHAFTRFSFKNFSIIPTK